MHRPPMDRLGFRRAASAMALAVNIRPEVETSNSEQHGGAAGRPFSVSVKLPTFCFPVRFVPGALKDSFYRNTVEAPFSRLGHLSHLSNQANSVFAIPFSVVLRTSAVFFRACSPASRLDKLYIEIISKGKRPSNSDLESAAGPMQCKSILCFAFF